MNEPNQTNKAGFIKGMVVSMAVIALLGGVFLVGKRFGSGTEPSPERSVGDSPTAPAPSGGIQLAAVTDDDWIKGDPDAPITIVEFSDLECPFCKRFHPTMQRLIDAYPNDVKWVYRHFPLSSLHPKAAKEAEATECAGELGGNDGFWSYVDRLFEITPSNNGLAESQLSEIAEDVDLDQDAFQTCLDSGKYAQKVQDHYSQAVAAGGAGTPHSIVITANGEKIPVQGALPYEQLKSIIDSII